MPVRHEARFGRETAVQPTTHARTDREKRDFIPDMRKVPLSEMGHDERVEDVTRRLVGDIDSPPYARSRGFNSH
jgi:hypothetical protein